MHKLRGVKVLIKFEISLKDYLDNGYIIKSIKNIRMYNNKKIKEGTITPLDEYYPDCYEIAFNTNNNKLIDIFKKALNNKAVFLKDEKYLNTFLNDILNVWLGIKIMYARQMEGMFRVIDELNKY